MEPREETILRYTEPVRTVFHILRNLLGEEVQTISSGQYDYYKEPSMPVSQTIVSKTKKSWGEILEILGLPSPLSRNTLSYLSNALHLLEKRIVSEMDIGWEEKSFTLVHADGKIIRRLRPDSCCTERLYLRSDTVVMLDVKLSILSAYKAISKYLPLFEGNAKEYKAFRQQHTFFEEWLSEEKSEPLQCVDEHGQLDLFRENHVLFICYLLGERHEDLLPGAKISAALKREKKADNRQQAKRLPLNMEVRFVPFHELPALYATLAGIEYSKKLQLHMEPILEISEMIKTLAQRRDFLVEQISGRFFGRVRCSTNMPVDVMLAGVREVLESCGSG